MAQIFHVPDDLPAGIKAGRLLDVLDERGGFTLRINGYFADRRDEVEYNDVVEVDWEDDTAPAVVRAVLAAMAAVTPVDEVAVPAADPPLRQMIVFSLLCLCVGAILGVVVTIATH